MSQQASIPTTSLHNSKINTNNIKLLQINLQRAKTATDQLCQRLQDNPADFAIIQEPYCIKGQVARIPRHWTIIQKQNDQIAPPRTAIIVPNNNWNPTILLSHRDIISISITTTTSQLIITSVYITPTEDPTTAITILTQLLQKYRCSHIVSGDFNSQNTVWGYSRTNARGTQLLEFINANNLILHNQDTDPPSFDNIYTKGWTDLQITTTHIAN
ncbi:hypothetical protein X975_24483, partial [Stegodyphus mimosarum]